MTAHSESRVIACSPETVFDLVIDVERYPEFLPLWLNAKVRRRDEDHYVTDQVIGLGPVRERFSSRTEYSRPEFIEITSSEGMFRSFSIRWHFAPTEDGRCRVDLDLEYAVRSMLLQKFIDAVLAETARTMISAFEDRARRLSS